MTSAPKIIVGRSLTKGMRPVKASTRTVFLPPTWIINERERERGAFFKTDDRFRSRKRIPLDQISWADLDVNLEGDVCKVLFAHPEHVLGQAALRYQAKLRLADSLQIPWEAKTNNDGN